MPITAPPTVRSVAMPPSPPKNPVNMSALAATISAMPSEIIANGVPERQQPGLAEQHVVGQRENDRDAHLRKHRQREALGENKRQQREEQCGSGPEDDA